MTRLDKQFLELKAQGSDIEETREEKLDKKIFNSTAELLEKKLHQLTQRVNYDEDQQKIFGEFVFQQLPLFIQVQITDNLNHVLDSDGLVKLGAYLADRVEKMREDSFKKIMLFSHMRDTKDRLEKKLEIIKGENISRIEMEIELKRAAEAANQRREDRLRLNIVQALEKKIQESEQS